MRIVLDTNVVVSGLLTPGGTCGKILDTIEQGKVVVCLDDRIWDEYWDVLHRPKFKLPPGDSEKILEVLALLGQRIDDYPDTQGLPDQDDACFLEVALGGGASYIVTGNLRDFPPALCRGMKILSPQRFLDLLAKER